MTTMTTKLTVQHIISWISGILIFVIGVINTFWGNDAGFGIAIILASFVFFPPVTDYVKKTLSLSVPGIAKIVMAMVILWAALGVGELFNKIELMTKSF
jgi:hypothetical protein